MISSGQPVNEYIDGAVRHVMLRQGVLGIKVGNALGCELRMQCRPTLCAAAQPLAARRVRALAVGPLVRCGCLDQM